ncbi:hypothetical protein ACFY8W_01295 [Streptomyces sp. NPDC012637]|uniref:hypothetical protein n=1 Tax=Streptomyces sp. NPDC012637 TaxID=3364842 RepID=UPI0036E45865
MLHPPAESPSRDARPPRRPGVVVLPVAALAAILALSFAVTARGGAGDGGPNAMPSAPAVPGAGLSAGTTSGPSAGAPSDTASGAPGQRPAAQGESRSPLPAQSKRPTTRRTADRDRREPTAPHPPAAAPTASGTTSPRPRGDATRRTPPAPVPSLYDGLRVGDCFDIDRDAPGTVVRRTCGTPHDAELVARLRLTGTYADDGAVRDAAAALCREPLRIKAVGQPLGTRWSTFVQYPYRTSYLLGETTVACSLAAPTGSARLTAPLQ